MSQSTETFNNDNNNGKDPASNSSTSENQTYENNNYEESPDLASTWQLSALSEALQGLTLTVNDSLSIGRGSDNDVVLGSKEVSRNHAILSVLNDKLYVKDLASSNGTFINDHKIESNQSKYLKPDDTLRFASFAFHVTRLDEAAPDADILAAAAEEVIEPSEILDADEVQAPLIPADLEPEVIEAVPLHDHHDTSEYHPASSDSAELEDSLPDPLLEQEEHANSEANLVEAEVIEDSLAKDNVVKEDRVQNDSQLINDTSEYHPASSDSAELEDSLPDPLLEEESTPLTSQTQLEEVSPAALNAEPQTRKVEDTAPLDFQTTPVVPKEIPSNDAIAKNPVTQEASVQKDSVQKASVQEAPIQQPAAQEPTLETAPFKDEHLVKTLKPTAQTDSETIVNEDAKATTSAPVIEETAVETTRISEPEVAPKVAVSPSPTLAADHDKTTTTPLQEEADPDILRAKQAATGQFTGTANLGAPRDVGTEGNNALDQALDNPANANIETKKPSGSWFIWVFLAVIVIGIIIWLFNRGMI